ncbi:MAG: hypothetical protein TR69_WS6001000169 [candidate division WS6 bacterium OLB20]|uniref:Apea-like HEPN domain-containing protein n=1 Tax=candidate division WS6 bacterium OLB20 TaxID=1617426 RepID=A0A136M071_9BACT|nr:MAG: hypothetical protein TR69_WS6001000169 [candidate division WS6 bacterium OLB20]
MRMVIYNLEFPVYVQRLTLDGYEFVRLENYEEAHSKMMWLVNSSGSEFSTNIQTGQHQATGTVQEINKEASLPWGNTNSTRLNDICLVLSIFTGRNVFAVEESVHNDTPTLISDHRMYNYGGILRCSIAYEAEYFNEDTLETLTESERENDEYYFVNQPDVGFGKGINQILDLISTPEWKTKYGDGYFLFLFKQAMQRMDIEPTFILCWAMWEHLFGALNPRPANKKGVEFTDEQIEKDLSGEYKITYFLVNYFGLVLNSDSRAEIRRIVNARNKLVHFGKRPKDLDLKEMELFIRATECLVCKILELEPSNVFNTNERLAEFLKLNET